MKFNHFFGALLFLSMSCFSLFGQAQKKLLTQDVFDSKWRTFQSYEDTDYKQKMRPQFHFTSKKNWLNDPNGLVYLDGEWHMFFQHNSLRNGDGGKVWGHAVSEDLISWRQLPHAILPYKNTKGKSGVIWSGSAVIDHNNSLKKQVGKTQTLVAFFTHTTSPMQQCAAYSTDKGRTFTLINGGDPVVPNQGVWKGERDPKVFWHEKTQKWVMAVIIAGPDKLIRIWNSDNLVNWKRVGDFSRDFVECFDMYELAVDGNPQKKKWVCNDAAFYYQIGNFDGTNFSSDNKMLSGDWGGRRFFKAFYAGQTFNNSPDGKVYQIAWMKDASKKNLFKRFGLPFTQQMSFPCELSLKSTAEGERLFRWPVDQIKKLYAKSHLLEDISSLSKVNSELNKISVDLLDVSISFEPKENEIMTFTVRGLEIVYGNKTRFPDKGGKMVEVKSIEFRNMENDNDTIKIPAPTIHGQVNLRILLDRMSIELFVNKGAYAAASYCLPKTDKISIKSSNGERVKINSILINELNSIWRN